MGRQSKNKNKTSNHGANVARRPTPMVGPDGDEATGLPPDPRFRSESQSLHIEQTSGDLPPPAMLRGYDDVVSNGAERLFRMAERESENRSIVVRSRTRNETLGMVLGFLAFLLFLGVAIWLVLSGHEQAGIAWMALQFGSTIWVRTYGHKILVDALKGGAKK